MKRIGLACALAATFAVPTAAVAVEPNSTDKENAAQQCKAQRTAMGAEAFHQLYGANTSKKNAFGKCVSKFARDEARERKAAKSNAAKDCKAEREADETAFTETYGTRKGKNAYGRCVSQKAKENKAEADEADEAKDEATVKAAKACRAEQKADEDAFAEKYGTNRNNRNAFGKCVSAQAKAQNDEQA